MNKEEYKKSLRRHYPDEPGEVLDLAWYFHSVEKAKKYIQLLETCNSNADLAEKAVREMYVSCDINMTKAVSEKFIKALLPFTCMEKCAKPHSVAYHIRKMLDDAQVKVERKSEEERLRQRRFVQQTDDSLVHTSDTPTRIADVTIQIQIRTANEEFIRQLMLLASQSNAVFMKVEERVECIQKSNKVSKKVLTTVLATAMDSVLGSVLLGCRCFNRNDLKRSESFKSKLCGLYQLECNERDFPLTMINLRSIFGAEEPEMTFVRASKVVNIQKR